MKTTSRIIVSLIVLTFVVFIGGTETHCAQIKQEDPVEKKMRDIAENLRCPVCQGQSVYDSNSDLAQQMKQTIKDRLNAGDSPDQIVGFFKKRYGNYVLMAPPHTGLHWGIWLVPFALVLAGGGVIVWRALRSSRRIIAAVGEGSQEDMERLEL